MSKLQNLSRIFSVVILVVLVINFILFKKYNIVIEHFYPVIWFCIFCNFISLVYFYVNRKINTMQNGNLNIRLGDGSNIEGHYYLSQNISDDEKGFIIIESVTKLCKEHNLSVVETFDNIQNNLKTNNLLLKI